MKRLLFILLMMTCSISWAAWEFVGETDTYLHYVDRATIRKKGNFFEMWDMQSYHEAQEDRYGKNDKSVKTLVRYGCKDETRGIVSLVHYSKEHGSGDVVFTGAVKKNEIEDVPIVPGSAAEHVWRIVCKHR